MARSFRRLKSELMLAVVLPDGSTGTVPSGATDVFGEESVESQLRAVGDVSRDVSQTAGGEPSVAVLTAEGVRRLRALLAVRSRGSESRGTRRRAAEALLPHSRQRDVEVSQVAKAQDTRSCPAQYEPAGGRRRAARRGAVGGAAGGDGGPAVVVVRAPDRADRNDRR